jgi:beta-ribofuranosylaminobenzene 5'-phosphate synthase
MSVSVSTTARLHFGFLDPSGRSTQPFGSFGLSLDRPATRLKLQRADAFAVTGPEAERAERYLKTIAASCGIDHAYRLHLDEVIPPHSGLGSGTQLALAVGSAFAALERLEITPLEIARRLARGARSGIGMATFEVGGAVLDRGPVGGRLPELVARVAFPDSWRALLIFDPSTKGLDGANEIAAFEALPDFPDAETAELREGIVQRALPALTTEDFVTFCAEVGNLQDKMGAYFAPTQGGGPYTNRHVTNILDWLRREGITGLGQSSWGPTGFAFTESEDAGEVLLAAARERASGSPLRFELAQGRNEGAEMEIQGKD